MKGLCKRKIEYQRRRRDENFSCLTEHFFVRFFAVLFGFFIACNSVGSRKQTWTRREGVHSMLNPVRREKAGLTGGGGGHVFCLFIRFIYAILRLAPILRSREQKVWHRKNVSGRVLCLNRERVSYCYMPPAIVHRDGGRPKQDTRRALRAVCFQHHRVASCSANSVTCVLHLFPISHLLCPSQCAQQQHVTNIIQFSRVSVEVFCLFQFFVLFPFWSIVQSPILCPRSDVSRGGGGHALIRRVNFSKG